jgi:hypothetical protein
METETHSEKRVREYWSKAYDDLIKSSKDNNNKNYEPTAVLTSQNNSSTKRTLSIYDIADLDLSR